MPANVLFSDGYGDVCDGVDVDDFCDEHFDVFDGEGYTRRFKVFEFHGAGVVDDDRDAADKMLGGGCKGRGRQGEKVLLFEMEGGGGHGHVDGLEFGYHGRRKRNIYNRSAG